MKASSNTSKPQKSSPSITYLLSLTFPLLTRESRKEFSLSSEAKSHQRWIVHSYACCLKGRGNSCRSIGAGVTGKAKQDGGEHLLKCSPTHEKRWEAKLGWESVACKMSIQQSMIKQTFDRGFTCRASLLHLCFNVQCTSQTSLTCVFVLHAWSTSCLSSKLKRNMRDKRSQNRWRLR